MNTSSLWTSRPLSLPEGAQIQAPAESLHYGAVEEHGSLFGELLQRTDTLVLPLHGNQVLVDGEGRLALIPAHSLRVAPKVVTKQSAEASVAAQYANYLYLGRVHPGEGIPGDGIHVIAGGAASALGEEVPVVSVMCDAESAALFTTGTWKPLREVSQQFDPLDLGLATRAVALSNWHQSHRFSPRTGQQTEPAYGGWVRLDTADGSQHFPRTDPAVIIAVTDACDRLLLASNTAWDVHRFSLIAGFVDPGESLEQAVVREVFEETGVAVRDPLYLGSQPWPFPASLMMGFHATLDETSRPNGKPDGVEIRALTWVSRDELRQKVALGEITLPGKASISRAIIDAWVGEPAISS